jgi:hypothetical protein
MWWTNGRFEPRRGDRFPPASRISGGLRRVLGTCSESFITCFERFWDVDRLVMRRLRALAAAAGQALTEVTGVVFSIAVAAWETANKDDL